MALHMTKGEVTLGVGMLPGRKRIAVYTINGCVLRSLAFFTDDSAAREFCRLIMGREDYEPRAADEDER